MADIIPPTPPGAIPVAPASITEAGGAQPPQVSQVASAPAAVVTEKSTVTATVSPPFWQGMLADIHVNASGLLMFVCLSIGVAYPDLKPKCTEIAALAGTYLFASAKAK